MLGIVNEKVKQISEARKTLRLSFTRVAVYLVPRSLLIKSHILLQVEKTTRILGFMEVNVHLTEI